MKPYKAADKDCEVGAHLPIVRHTTRHDASATGPLAFRCK